MDKLTAEQQNYDLATRCHTCDIIFNERNVKVRHHDHVTGKFVAATCNNCNLRLKPRMSRAKDPSVYELKIRTLEEYKERLEKMNQMDENCREKKKGDHLLPIIFHNLKGYDSHLIITIFKKQFAVEEIKVIASNTEKFISFQTEQKRFLDSLQFLNASLDTLVANLKKDGSEKFQHTKRHFPENEDLIIRKGIYPYEYMSGL